MAGHWQQMSAFNFNYSEFVKHQEVNLFGFASCISEILPKMIESNQGVIAGVSSVAGYRGLSGGAAYGASKAAQLNLLESLRVDLQKTGVRVQTISPGFVKTPMTATNDFPMPFLISAEAAAKAIVDGLERGKAEIVFPLPMSILMKSAKLIPQSIWPKLFSRSAKKP
jgi:short-subunit dehydrogenase